MNELIGKKIKQIYMLDNDFLLFITDTGERFCYRAEGECCSDSWFEHFSDVDNLIDAKILQVEDIYMGDPYEPGQAGQELKIYGIKFKTTKGYADLEFRNQSNGYYGGSLQLVSLPSDTTMDGFKLIVKDF